MQQLNPRLSIIITSFNTKNLTLSCIRSIISSQISVPYEIIVVDNNSKDETVKEITNLKSSFDKAQDRQITNNKYQLSIIENKQNLGFAKANNQGVDSAQGEYILLLNSDTVILHNAVNKLLSFSQEHPEIHFLGPKLFNKDMTPQPSCAYFYSLPIVFFALFLRGDYWGLTRWSPNHTQKVDWLSGACILTKRKYYKFLLGFDERIFMYMDEVDLLYRAHKTGLTTYCYPEAHVIHLGSASSTGRTEPILQVYKGFLYFYLKHHSKLEINLLKNMLQLKAFISLIIGFVINNQYLKKTYAKALEIIR